MSSSDLIGAWPPPDGVTANFVNPESIASEVIIAAIVCPVLTSILVGLRLYTVQNILRSWNASDGKFNTSPRFSIAPTNTSDVV
jgi:hypothetical protein